MHTPKLKWVIKVTIVFLWLFTIVTVYFWAHKPFDASIVAGLGQSLLNVAVWMGITLLGAALGRRVLGGLLDDEWPITRLALSAGVGLGLLSLLMLGLGAVGLFRPVAAWGLILVLGWVLRRDVRASLTDLRAVRLPWPVSGFHRWLAIYGFVSLLLTFLTALAPPTGWDTLVYHLTGPRLFVEAHHLVHPIDLPYLGFPQLGEMQFTLGLLLVGEGVAPLLHFGYGLLALIITVSLAQCTFGNRVAWLTAALLLSVPTLFSLMTWAYVDATLLFYATAAFYAFLRWRERAREKSSARRWLLLVGLYCGFCGGIKYTAVLIPVALGLSIVYISRRDGLRAITGRLTLVALVAGAVVLPGLLENLLTTGNPVYPFFFTTGIHWDEWRSWWYDRPGTGLATTAPWRLLTAPLEATVLGTQGTVFYEATIGPLLLPSVALLILVWRSLNREERAIAGHLLLFFGMNYALWLNGLARTAMLLRTRFLFLTFGVAAVLGGVALDRLRTLRRPQLAVDWVVRVVMSLTLALLLFSTAAKFLEINPLPVVLGMESREDYLTRRLGWYYATIEYINQELPPDASVLFLWEPRSYHCRLECLPDAMLDRWLHTVHIYGHSAGAIADAWRAEGVTHVLLYRTGYQTIIEAGFDPITAADQATLATLLSRMAQIKDFGNVYELYAFQGTNNP